MIEALLIAGSGLLVGVVCGMLFQAYREVLAGQQAEHYDDEGDEYLR